MQTVYEGEAVAEKELTFDRKIAACDGLEYSVGGAEEKDLQYLIENSCMRCNRLLAKKEIKVVPPQSVQEKDQYVMGGVVQRRVMCVLCYDEMISTTREKLRHRYKRARSMLREKVLKAFITSNITQRKE